MHACGRQFLDTSRMAVVEAAFGTKRATIVTQHDNVTSLSRHQGR